MCSQAAHSFRNGICLLSVMNIFLCFSGKVRVGGWVWISQFSLYCGKRVVLKRKKNPFNGSSRSVPYILELTQYSSWHMAVLLQMLAE